MKIKKLVVALVTIAVFVFGQSAMALPQGLTDVVIKITAFLGPEIPGSRFAQIFVNNAVQAQKTGATSMGNQNTPGYWTKLIGDEITPGQAVLTENPSWGGILNPIGSYSVERGNGLYFGFDITSNVRFSLNEIMVRFESPFFNIESTFEDAGVGYALQGSGEYWNQDGTIKILGPGEEGTFGNRQTGIGASFFFSTDAKTQAELNRNIEEWGSDPFDVVATYSVGGVSASYTVHVVPIPEPGTWAILSIGTVMLGVWKFRSYRRLS